jgi:hypothetical protein
MKSFERALIRKRILAEDASSNAILELEELISRGLADEDIADELYDALYAFVEDNVTFIFNDIESIVYLGDKPELLKLLLFASKDDNAEITYVFNHAGRNPRWLYQGKTGIVLYKTFQECVEQCYQYLDDELPAIDEKAVTNLARSLNGGSMEFDIMLEELGNV